MVVAWLGAIGARHKHAPRTARTSIHFHDLQHIAAGVDLKTVSTPMGIRRSPSPLTFTVMPQGASRATTDRLEQSLGCKTVAAEDVAADDEPQVLDISGGSAWTRTKDQGIMSPLL